MMKPFLIVLICLLPLCSIAKVNEGPSCKKKEKCKSSQCDIMGMEDFIFSLPDAANGNCEQDQAFENTVVSFYRWYLQHENMIHTGLTTDDSNRDLLPPLNITWKTLQQYFEIIKKKYPDLICKASSSAPTKTVLSGTNAVPTTVLHTSVINSQAQDDMELDNSSSPENR